MAKQKWTDEQVEQEIDRLLKTEEVRLARRENQLKYKRRQYMWSLQYMEARGKQLASEGVTMENIEEKLFGGGTEPTEDAQ